MIPSKAGSKPSVAASSTHAGSTSKRAERRRRDAKHHKRTPRYSRKIRLARGLERDCMYCGTDFDRQYKDKRRRKEPAPD